MRNKAKLLFILSVMFISSKAIAIDANGNSAPILDSINQKFIDSLSPDAPPIYKLSPTDARKVLSDVQAKYPSSMRKVDIEEKELSVDNTKFKIYILRPKGNNKTLPAIVYFHGGGGGTGRLHEI